MKENNKINKNNNKNTKVLKNKTTWGIGIEHEMRVRFEKGYFQFSKEFTQSFFPDMMMKTLQNSSGYIFLNALLLMYYFFENEVFQMKTYFEYAKTKEELMYSNEILIMYNLFKKAKSKQMYPLDNELYFKRSKDKEQIELNLKRFKFYLKIYNLYHNPLLFFDIEYKDNTEYSIKFLDLWNYKYQIENIENQDVFLDFMKDYKNYLNGGLFKIWRDKLNFLLQNQNVKNIYMDLEYEKLDDFSDNYEIKMVLNLSNIQDIRFNKNNMNYSHQISYQNIKELEYKYLNSFKQMIDNQSINDFESQEEKNKFYHSLFLLYKHKIPVLDFASSALMIEFTTVTFKNISFQSIHEQLLYMEKSFFKVMNHIPVFNKYTKIFGDLTYHNIGSVSESLEIYDIVNFEYQYLDKDYTGSYHIWVTPPYHPTTSTKRFNEECATLANKFQLIEPLIAAHFTSPSMEAFGDDRSIPRSSLRQFVGRFSNYGTADISFLMGTPHHMISKYFLSENDLKNYMETGQNKSIKNYFEVPLYLMNGKPYLNYYKLEDRILTSRLYDSFTKGNINSNPPKNLTDYYSIVFDKSKIRPIDNKLILGPDIRTKDYDKLVYPNDNKWKVEIIKKENKFCIVWVNYDENKISYEPVFDKVEMKKRNDEGRIGIEFRVFDHFNTENLEQILRILSCFTYQSASHPYTVTSKNMYIHEKWWHEEMARVIMEGYEYKPSNIYLKNLSKEFDISSIRIRTDLSKHTKTSKTYTQMVFEKIYEKMNEKFIKSPLYNKLRFKKDVIPFQSMNKKAWYNIFTFFLLKNPNLYKDLSTHEHIEDKDILKILGQKYRYNVKRVKKYITNIKQIKNKSKLD